MTSGPSYAVILPRFGTETEGIEVWPHDFTRRYPCPLAFVSTRAIAGIVRHDLRLDFRFNLGEKRLNVSRIDLGHLIFDHEPGHWIQITAVHLHS